MKCNFVAAGSVAPLPDKEVGSGRGSFAFKLTYDEEHARASPGYQLEVANIRLLHERPELQWMDSCSAAGPSLYDHLWLDGRAMQTMLLSTGRVAGNMVVSLLPRLRRMKQLVARLLGKRQVPDESERDSGHSDL